MKPEELRDIITIQEPVETPDDNNTPEVSWQNFATVRAYVGPLRESEYLLVQNTSTESKVRIKIRYLPGIKSSMRILYDSRVFQIQSRIDKGGRHREIHLECVEVSN